ncbi:MAG TPA: hypothetical protein VF322_05840 [Gammaproteobacteria bacterium]
MSGRERLAMAFLTLHPDAAARLLEGMPAGTARAVLARAEPPLAAAVVDKMLATDAARCLEQLPPDAAAAITAALGVPEAAAVIRHLPPAAREALLAAAAPQRAVALRLLLSYPPHTVGAWMDATALALPDDCPAGEARERVERERQEMRQRIYVLDRWRRIRGAVPTPTLLRSASGKKLAALVEPAPSLWAREPLASAQDSEVWERHADAPVVNRDHEYVGVLSYADLRRAQKQLAGQAPHAGANGAGANGAAEVAELFAVGASTLWQGLADFVGGNRAAGPEDGPAR